MAHSKFGFDPIDDAYHAISAWSSWHNGCLIPLGITDDADHFSGDGSYLVPYLQSAAQNSPNLADQLRAFAVCHTPSESAALRQKLLAQSSYLIDIGTPAAPALSAAQVSELLQCQAPVHYVFKVREYDAYGDCTIHLWGRPQATPSAAELTRPANKLAPNVERRN